MYSSITKKKEEKNGDKNKKNVTKLIFNIFRMIFVVILHLVALVSIKEVYWMLN